MKRPILAAALALAAWAAADQPASAWHKTQVSMGFNFCRESTGWCRTMTYHFSSNPPPGCCPGGQCCYNGPSVFDHPPAYAAHGYPYPPPAAPAPGFAAPQPTPAAPAPKAGTPPAQQVGYFPQAGYGNGYNAGYGYGYGGGYGYGAGYGYGYESAYNQAPSYWYGN